MIRAVVLICDPFLLCRKGLKGTDCDNNTLLACLEDKRHVSDTRRTFEERGVVCHKMSEEVAALIEENEAIKSFIAHRDAGE